MKSQTEYPQELLSQSQEARLRYFQDKVVAHPHLKETHQKLWNAIQQPAGNSLIFVFGPTGVGKTTLRLRLEQQLREVAQPVLEQNPGHIPVVGLEVAAPDAGNFRWRDYYKRALIALDEPLIDKKINYGVRNLRRNGDGHLVIGQHAVTSELRWALEQALYHRRPAAFILDEAQHFKKMSSGRRLLDQMDILKSLANMTNTVHVLIGTYELLNLANLSAQLNRRSIDIHFPRYRPDVVEDMLAFKSVLLTFQKHLPLANEPDLVGQAEYFYERSAGCVGVLKDWLLRALAAILVEGQETLTNTILECHALPSRKLLRMAREIKEGEEILLGSGPHQKELRALLNLPAEPRKVRDKNTHQHVGQRKPRRDPVGSHEPAT